MALPVGALSATVTVSLPLDLAGVAGTIEGFSVYAECPLVWAATGESFPAWSATGSGSLTILADQPGVFTSGTVDGAAAMVEVRGWPLIATWRPVKGATPGRREMRRFSSALLTPGATVDLDLLPVDGQVPPAAITYAQAITWATDATTGAKGTVQLAGDLGGTAAAPTVPGLAGKAPTVHTHTAAAISDSTAAGRALLTAADAAAQRAALRVGRSIQITQATPRFGVKNYNDTGDFYTLRSVYHVWDSTVMNTGAVYGLSEPSSTGVTPILRSLDGGVSWTKLGSVTVSIAGHELLEHIYVEPYYETILVVKNMNTTLNNNYHVLTLDNTCALKAELDLGANRTWHGGMQNVDSVDKAGSWATRIIMFSEYTNNSAATARIMKSEDKGLTWTIALEKGANNGAVNTGQIRHFHCCQVDPFTKHWWAASGDADAQCNIWRSTDEGATWTVIFSGDQNARTLGFVFENGYLYYGMDSPSAGGQYQSLIYRVDKTTLARTQVAAVPAGLAIYMMTRTFYPAGFLVWTADELRTAPSVGVYFFDYHTQELSSVFEFYLGSSGGGVQEASRYQDRETGLVWVKPSSALFRDVYGYGGTSSTLSEILKARLV